MTKLEAIVHYELVRDVAIKEADERVKHVLNSGALNLEDENGISIGKILACDAFRYASGAIYPFHPVSKKVVENLKHF